MLLRSATYQQVTCAGHEFGVKFGVRLQTGLESDPELLGLESDPELPGEVARAFPHSCPYLLAPDRFSAACYVCVPLVCSRAVAPHVGPSSSWSSCMTRTPLHRLFRPVAP